jgi:phenylacetic acid degradation operon negative regulatory protein
VNKGWIKYVDKNNDRFVKLTKKGQLEALLAKARIPAKPGKWDGKWRVIIFDIPEESEEKRDFFRYLLKKNGFIKLQQSVYINPHPLNRDAIVYLKKSGLIGYIRVLKVEEMDNDKDLKKKFGLT